MHRSTNKKAGSPGRNKKCTQSGKKNITCKFHIVAKAHTERENVIGMEISSTKQSPQASPWNEGKVPSEQDCIQFNFQPVQGKDLSAFLFLDKNNKQKLLPWLEGPGSIPS